MNLTTNEIIIGKSNGEVFYTATTYHLISLIFHFLVPPNKFS